MKHVLSLLNLTAIFFMVATLIKEIMTINSPIILLCCFLLAANVWMLIILNIKIWRF